MSKTMLSVTFIDDINNREWTYDDVDRIETGVDSIFIYCGNNVFAPLNPEFTRISIRKENDSRPITNAEYIRNLSDDRLTEWLCGQLWDDYGKENSLDVIRYHSIRNYLKMEYKK